MAAGGATAFAEEDDACKRLCCHRPQAHAGAERDAYARCITKALPRAPIRSSRAGACGRRVLAVRRPPMAMPCRVEHRDQPHRRRRRRRRLLASRRRPRRFCAGRRRHQFQCRQWLAPGAPTCSRPAPSCGTRVGAAYITAALAYGWQDITTDRTVTIAGIDQLRAQFNANAWSGRVEGGYRFVAPWMGGIGITPYAAGQFTTFDLPAYAEQALSGANTFALTYGAKSVTASRSELGLRTDKSFAMQDAILTLRGRAAWAHDFNTDRSIAATFQTLPGASFVVNGAAQAHDAALTTASAEMKWHQRPVRRRHLRRRVLRRHPQLRRQGRGALRLVSRFGFCGESAAC